jgi:hypothetical protein
MRKTSFPHLLSSTEPLQCSPTDEPRHGRGRANCWRHGRALATAGARAAAAAGSTSARQQAGVSGIRRARASSRHVVSFSPNLSRRQQAAADTEDYFLSILTINRKQAAAALQFSQSQQPLTRASSIHNFRGII